MTDLLQDYRYLVLTGNYGSGKTELALNLALQFSQSFKTTLVDLDLFLLARAHCEHATKAKCSSEYK